MVLSNRINRNIIILSVYVSVGYVCQVSVPELIDDVSLYAGYCLSVVPHSVGWTWANYGSEAICNLLEFIMCPVELKEPIIIENL